MTYEQIRKHLNVSHPTIAKVLKENGLHVHNKYPLKVMVEIKSMASMGIRIREIAEKLNLSYTGLKSMMSKNKIYVTRNNENMYRVLELSDEYTAEEIAVKTGLNINYIRTIRYRKGVNKSLAGYRRERAIKLINEGKTVDEVSEIIGVLPITIVRYIKNY